MPPPRPRWPRSGRPARRPWARAWAAAHPVGAGGRLPVDLDATITLAYSVKEAAQPTFKGTFGHHPLRAFASRARRRGAAVGPRQDHESSRPILDSSCVRCTAQSNLPRTLSYRGGDAVTPIEPIAMATTLITAGVLAYSAIAKVVAPEGAYRALRFSGLGQRLSQTGVLLVIVAELSVSTILILGTKDLRRVAAGGGVVLLVTFSLWIGWLLGNNRRIACGCFGPKSQTISRTTLLRNILLIAPVRLRL